MEGDRAHLMRSPVERTQQKLMETDDVLDREQNMAHLEVLLYTCTCK